MAVSAELRRNASLVAIAGLAYGVLLLFVTDFASPLSADEMAALRPLSAAIADDGLWRGVGSGLIGLPVGLWDAPAWLVRLWFVVLSVVGLIGAFRRWVRPAGKVAWTAAAIFAASWVPLAGGGSPEPGLYTALAAVTAAGFAMRWCVERDRGALVGIAVFVAVACWFRPIAGTALACGLVLVLAVWVRDRSGPALAAALLGLTVGWLPWIVATASGATATALFAGPGDGAGGYLALVEGPLRLNGLRPPFTWRAGLWLAVLAALAVTGITQKRWNHRRNAALVGVTISTALTIGGLATGGVADVRLLLPAYALLVIAVSAGLLNLWHHVARRISAVPVTVATVVLSGVAVVWQIVIAAGQT